MVLISYRTSVPLPLSRCCTVRKWTGILLSCWTGQSFLYPPLSRRWYRKKCLASLYDISAFELAHASYHTIFPPCGAIGSKETLQGTLIRACLLCQWGPLQGTFILCLPRVSQPGNVRAPSRFSICVMEHETPRLFLLHVTETLACNKYFEPPVYILDISGGDASTFSTDPFLRCSHHGYNKNENHWLKHFHLSINSM